MSTKKQPTVPVAVFDISSASVGGAHALVRRDSPNDTEKVVLLSQTREAAPVREELDTKRFVSDTVKGLESVARALHSQDKLHPEHIQIVLASPWYTSHTRTISYEKNTEFIFTKQLLNELISKEIDHILIHEKDRFEGLGGEYTIVEKQISQIILNGYVVEQPYDKKARSLEVSLTITIVPKFILAQFKEAIERIYTIKHIQVTTSAYTTFIAMRENAPISQSCVLVDIGEEMTDVAFVKDGVFLYQHSFPVGTAELPRLVSKMGGYEIHEVPAVLDAYRLDTLVLKKKKLVEKALLSFRDIWQKQIQEVVDDGYYGFALPAAWYVVTEPKLELLFKNILSTDPYILHHSVALPVVDIVTSDELYSITKPIDVELDIPLALALLFIEKLL